MSNNKILRVPCKFAPAYTWHCAISNEFLNDIFLKDIEEVIIGIDDIDVIYRNNIPKKHIKFYKIKENVISRNDACGVTPKIYNKLLKHLEPYIAEVIEITED